MRYVTKLLLLAFALSACAVADSFTDHPPVSVQGGPYHLYCGACFGQPGYSVTFDGSASFDPDIAAGDSIAWYDWRVSRGTTLIFDGGQSSSPLTTWTPGFVTPGEVLRLDLIVADTFGFTSTTETPLFVQQGPPPAAATPEPGSLMLLGSGLIGLGAGSRRKFIN